MMELWILSFNMALAGENYIKPNSEDHWLAVLLTQ